MLFSNPYGTTARRWVCAAAGLIGLVIAVQGNAAPANSRNALPGFFDVQEIARRLEMADANVQALTFEVDETDVVRTLVEVDDETWTLELRKHSVRADGFQLLTRTEAGGEYEPVEAPPIATYKGIVVERPEARVRAMFLDGGLTGMILLGDEAYGIAPVVSLGLAAAASEHVVYRASDWLNPFGYHCGNDHAPPFGQADDELETEDDGGVAGTGLKITDIAIEADFEFFQLNGSNLNNTLIDMENVINGTEGIYEAAAIGITYEVTVALVDQASPGDYSSTDPGTRLCQFRTRWLTAPQTNIQRDVAHLFTGVNIDGSVIGIAGTFGGICNQAGTFPQCTASGNHAFCLSQSRFTTSMTSRVGLTAHELGHLWSAVHCDGCGSCTSCCRVMCSGLGGCTGILTSFGCQEITQIVAHKNSRTCLADLADPQPFPFFDDFPTSTLSTAKWSYNNGTAIVTTATNEPSGTMSLGINAAGSSTHQDDDIRTNFILLGGQPQGQVTYFVERVGVESGEQLFVEYWGTNGLWNNLTTHTSNGVDQTTFTFFSHPIPANGLHNEFRLRFRPDVSETNDVWHIDDVSVTANSPAAIATHPVSQSVCQGAAAAFSVAASGTAPITFQWKKNGVNIGGATAATFNIPAANLSDAANYTCMVTNAFGNDESDPATLTVLTNASCNDGAFCNGVETCVAGACADGPNPCPQACRESSGTCQPYPSLTCDMVSDTASPGDEATVELFISQALDLHGYQTRISVTRTSGTGSVTVECPDGVVIDSARPDFVYLGLGSFNALDCSQARLASAIFNSVEVPVAPKYLGEYSLTVSADAAPGSTFEIALQPEAEDTTFLRDSVQNPIPFTIGGACTLTITQCAVYGDVAQPLNGIVNIDDIICVLNGFSLFSNCILGDLSPCNGNGAIDLDDILAVLSAFSGNDPCCGGGGPGPGPGPSPNPAPTPSTPRSDPKRSSVMIELLPRTSQTVSGGTLFVDAFAEGLTDLRGYELASQAHGGSEGRMTLIDLFVDGGQEQPVFGDEPTFVAVDPVGGRLANAAMTGRAVSTGRVYLASFAFQASPNAAGRFEIGLRTESGVLLRDSNGKEVTAALAGPVEVWVEPRMGDGPNIGRTDR